MLLDLFCGAGGAGMGYSRAGFRVVGVDLNPQPNYPFEFVQADAMTWPLDGYDAIHASPPCQEHSRSTPVSTRGDHDTGWMLSATIERLRDLAVPWLVENVEGPTVTMNGWWFVLCGSSFGLKVRRHRRFGSNVMMLSPSCRHAEQGRAWTVTGHGGGKPSRHSMKPAATEFWRYLDMPWMEGKPPAGVAQAIPPAYTEWIGGHLLAVVKEAA